MNENSLEYLKLLLEKSRYGVIACDNDFRITFINQRVYEIHGVSPEEDPNTWEEYATVMEPDGVTPTPQDSIPLFRALRGEKVRDAYHVLKYQDKTSLLVKYNAEPLFDDSGKQIGAICTSEDSEDLVSTLARFRAIFAQSPLSIQILNKEGKTLLVNDSYQKLWGISDEFINEVILKTYNILEDEILIKSGEIEHIRRAFQGEIIQLTPFLYDPATLGLPGRARWAGGLIYPLLNTQGEVHEVVIIHRDVTDQRSAEEEKERLFSQLEAILRQMPAGVMVADSTGNISLYNEKMMRLIGDPSQAMNIFRELMDKSFKGEVQTSQEIQIQTKETLQVLSASSGPIQNSEGKISAGVVIARDISREKRIIANQAFLARVKTLLISDLDYHRVLSQIADVLIPYLADGCMVDVIENDKIQRIVTKHDRPEIEEYMYILKEKFPPDWNSPQPSIKAMKSGLSELLVNVDSERIRERTYNQDHFELISKIGIHSHIAIPLVARGKIIGAMNFFISNTNKPKFDEVDFELGKNIARYASIVLENARLYRDARSAIQLRDDFISMASHELRTPITSMNLQIEVLRSIADGIEKKSEAVLFNKFLDSTKNQLGRLTKLVDDMLDISRINTAKLNLNKRTTNLKKVIQEVLDRFEEQFSSQNINYTFFCDAEVSFYGDADRLDQVITNFMTNAIRYGNKKPVHIHLSESADHVTIKVQDFGRGVQKKDQERIFNRFERAHTSEDVSGLGLGLYINKQIIDEHGGTITLVSEPGEGSTFIVELPKTYGE